MLKYPQYCLFFTYTYPMQVNLFNSNIKSKRKNGKTGVRKKFKMTILSTSFVTDSHIKKNVAVCNNRERKLSTIKLNLLAL